MVFSIEALPAREGDCFWIEYGDADKPRVILVDGGRKLAHKSLEPRLDELARRDGAIELLVLTHVDADHLEGFLELIESDRKVKVKDVWFNDYDRLIEAARRAGIEVQGAKQGERIGAGIVTRRWPWNVAFDSGPAGFPAGSPPVLTLDGGLKVTLLSPTYEALSELIPTWKKECLAEGIAPGSGPKEAEENLERMGAGPTIGQVEQAAQVPFKADTSKANLSSIAFVLAYDGKSMLLTGDAHVSVIAASIESLGLDGRLEVDLWKLSHHGSKGTTSKELVEAIESKFFLISTDGSRHDHPDIETIARILKFHGGMPKLAFNHDNEYMRRWDSAKLKNKFDYSTLYPNEDGLLRINL
ncbi:ComEC/Rec2 family competence protein [Reyranella sp.]|uniref:ComEC/Rec2 family competence protein n=1 Tax=Reyranella sp. TaxID=1929291 RepID=UPI0027303557|nr:hypothetical protein [Reyranella sp.]MDP2373916.1 hypothetical protein [Reyranella sp.]